MNKRGVGPWFLLFAHMSVGCGGLDRQEAHASRVAAPLGASTSWIEEQLVYPDDPPALPVIQTGYGSSVALGDGTLVVGAPGSSKAYVFVQTGASWVQQQILFGGLAMVGQTPVSFGAAVAISKDTLLVGLPLVRSAVVYVRNGTTWSQQQVLHDFAAANFGASVAVDGDTAMVAAPGSSLVEVFSRTGTTWMLKSSLQPSDTGTPDFGAALVLSGDTAIMSANASVYAFTYATATWSQSQKFGSPNPIAGAGFASSLALSGDTLIVGALADDPFGTMTGAAYVYTRTAGTWAVQQKLLDPIRFANTFGASTTLEGDTAFIGERDALHVFSRTATTWTWQQEIGIRVQALASGAAIAIVTDIDQDYGAGVYVYAPVPTGDPCSSISDCAHGSCVEGVCCDTPCDGVCVSCLAARKGTGGDGTCGPVAVDSDPRNSCPATGTTCGTTGACDGHGFCEVPAPGVNCGPASCATATSRYDSSICDGTGSCVPADLADCPPGDVCTAGVCDVPDAAPPNDAGSSDGAAGAAASDAATDALAPVNSGSPAGDAGAAGAPVGVGPAAGESGAPSGGGPSVADAAAADDAAVTSEAGAPASPADKHATDSSCACRLTGVPVRAPAAPAFVLSAILLWALRRRSRGPSAKDRWHP